MKFPSRWTKWIGACLKSSWASVLVNGSPTSEFKLQRGLRQGDPLSPFLFILAMEALEVIMKRADERGVFKGINLPNNGPCISHLCYADDVIFMGEWSETNIKNLNRILRCFFLCSGLKVNLDKSSITGVGVEVEEVERMAEMLKCRKGTTPFKFLGLTVGANMKRVKHWKPVIDKFNTKLSAWKAKCLSFAGRVVLAKAVLGALPNYYFSLYPAPKKVINTLDVIRRDFIWGRKAGRFKIRWIAWSKMIRMKQHGGFGLGDLRSANIAFLIKWWWKYKTKPEELWTKVIKSTHESKRSNNFLPINNTFAGTWKDIVGAGKELEKMGIVAAEELVAEVGSGTRVKFWLDNWIGGRALKDKYPEIFRIIKNKKANIVECRIQAENEYQWNFEWVRPPNTDNEWAQWTDLMQELNGAEFKDGEDRWVWNVSERGEFSVANVRKQINKLQGEGIEEQWKYWNSWVPPKINYFTWRAAIDKIPVKRDVRNKRNRPYMLSVSAPVQSKCGKR
ncbi:putative RNA-directed DNA polymerase [Helianthus annuus]|nr:putative RNA-directed DNA polymerase [Helianthus annuus]